MLLTDEVEKQTALNVNLNKSKTVFIIPFTLKEDFTNLHETLVKSDWDIPKKVSRKNILEHVKNLIQFDYDSFGNGTIGREYILKDESREKYKLPVNTSHKFYLLTKKGDYIFKVNKVSIFLFETKIGFLTFEIIHTNKSLEQIVSTNYYIKHLHHLYHSQLLNQKEYYLARNNAQVPSDRVEESPLTMSSIAMNLLEPIGVDRYFSSENNEPESAIVYNSLMIDETFEGVEGKEKLLGEYLFKLRRTFKESYKPAPNELMLDKNPQIIQLFENSYWGVSLEGFTNVIHLTNDHVTNEFFNGNYQSNLAQSYFYLYIIALHQRYALLALNSRAQDMPKSEQLSVADFEKIQKLRKEINYFILRSFFKHVSSITHQQALYEKIEKCLQIEALKEDLRLELDALSSVAELQQYYRLKEQEADRRRLREQRDLQRERDKEEQERKDKLEDQRKEKHADIFLIWSTVFVVFSAITGTWSVIADLFIKSNQPLIHYSANKALLIIAALLILGGIGAFLSVKKKWGKTNSTTL